MHFFVDAIFAAGAVHATTIQRTVHVAFEVFRQTVETMNGVAQSMIVITTVATVVAIVWITILRIASPLRSRCNRQAERQHRRSKN